MSEVIISPKPQPYHVCTYKQIYICKIHIDPKFHIYKNSYICVNFRDLAVSCILSRSYLVDLVETVHLFLKMLEHYCKKTGLVVQKKVRKKTKSKSEYLLKTYLLLTEYIMLIAKEPNLNLIVTKANVIIGIVNVTFTCPLRRNKIVLTAILFFVVSESFTAK